MRAELSEFTYFISGTSRIASCCISILKNKKHSQVHLPKSILCFGCQEDHAPFATYSAMLLHLESGFCSAGWKIHHINHIANTSTGAEKLIIKDQFDWFMAGAPRLAAWSSDYDSASRRWNCPICPTTYSERADLTKHLFLRTCSNGYPKVLSCPQCSQSFTKLSSMLQHVETPCCEASYEEGVIADLLKHLKQDLDTLTPQMLVGHDLYKLKRRGSDEELIVTITDADQESGEFDVTLAALTSIGCRLLARKIYRSQADFGNRRRSDHPLVDHQSIDSIELFLFQSS